MIRSARLNQVKGRSDGIKLISSGPAVSRRRFLKYSLATAGAAAVALGGFASYRRLYAPTLESALDDEERLISPGLREDEWFKTAHLLRRAGFGPTLQEIEEYANLGLDKAVTRIVNYEGLPDRGPSLNIQFSDNPMDARKEFPELIAWWMNRMIQSVRPLEEKMTLFWHNHFATSALKVRFTQFMYNQNQLFRQNALGNFRDLTLAVAKDPAMLIWLDGYSNRKSHPNENFARELLELFTLGFGHYTEEDIREAARAFTGWTISRQTGQFTFNTRQHDNDMKTFMGQTGNFDGEDIIDIASGKWETARHISRKLWEFFAYPNPSDQIVDGLAKVYFDSDYSIRAMVEAIFRSDEFYSPSAYHAKVKSPVEFVVGGVRMLGASINPRVMIGYSYRMGQLLFLPPNVGGWARDLNWINTSAMFWRFNFVNALQTKRQTPASAFDPVSTVKSSNIKTPEMLVDEFLKQLVHSDIPAETRSAIVNLVSVDSPADLTKADSRIVESRVLETVRMVMATPEYQLA